MREAFAPERGRLTDLQSERAEQTARMEMFAGAVGSYKNPLSHRDVRLADASEAIEIVLFANHLLRIFDRRVEAAASSISIFVSPAPVVHDAGSNCKKLQTDAIRPPSPHTHNLQLRFMFLCAVPTRPFIGARS
jgi:hypothetical protein